jgi:threonine dehydrogenase-like Zn-dependent dehydrogenase
MKALQKTKSAPGLDIQTVLAPTASALADGDVLLRVHSTGVCGTDLHIDAWTPSYHFLAKALPVTVGHEFSGEVVSVGANVAANHPNLAVGALVAVRPSTVCGQCAACQADDFDNCVQRRGIGVLRDGGFAPWVVVPARNCVIAPKGVPAEVAALAEPLTVSHEAVRVGGVKAGDRVLILGPGNIGQGIALFAKAAGASQVVIAGFDDAPRFAVLKKMGFTDLLDFAQTTMDEALAPFLANGKFDVVIEATGAAAVIAPALAALKTHGVLVITGIHAKAVPIDLTSLVRNHQELRGSYRAPERNWLVVMDFMREHHRMLAHMITHRLPLERALEGFALARNKQATKVMIQPKLEAE